MVFRGELVQRYGPGGCIFLTSHTPFNQIADLYPDSARTLAWSSPCEPVSAHLNASSYGTLAPCPDATVLKGGCYVLPL